LAKIYFGGLSGNNLNNEYKKIIGNFKVETALKS